MRRAVVAAAFEEAVVEVAAALEAEAVVEVAVALEAEAEAAGVGLSAKQIAEAA
jgi:hypothetical protein